MKAPPLPFSTRETVVCDTLSSRARSRMVGGVESAIGPPQERSALCRTPQAYAHGLLHTVTGTDDAPIIRTVFALVKENFRISFQQAPFFPDRSLLCACVSFPRGYHCENRETSGSREGMAITYPAPPEGRPVPGPHGPRSVPWGRCGSTGPSDRSETSCGRCQNRFVHRGTFLSRRHKPRRFCVPRPRVFGTADRAWRQISAGP